MSSAQRRALIGLLAFFAILVGVGLLKNPRSVDDPFVQSGVLSDQLVDRIDPNVADVATLAALPNMGPARAQAIVEYRDRVRAGDPDRVVFQKLDDLMRVKGVGVALTRLAEPYLVFPVTPSTELLQPER